MMSSDEEFFLWPPKPLYSVLTQLLLRLKRSLLYLKNLGDSHWISPPFIGLRFESLSVISTGFLWSNTLLFSAGLRGTCKLIITIYCDYSPTSLALIPPKPEMTELLALEVPPRFFFSVWIDALILPSSRLTRQGKISSPIPNSSKYSL